MDKTDILLYNDSEVPFYPRTNASSIKTTTESTNGSFMTQQEIDDALWDSRITKGTLLGTINGVEFNYGDDIAVSSDSTGGSNISLNAPLQDINSKLKTTPRSKDTYLKYNGSIYVWDTISSTSSAKSLQILDNKNNGYSYNGNTNTILQFGSGITTKLSNTNDTQIVQVSVSGNGGSSSETYTDLTVTGDLVVEGDISSTNINNSGNLSTTTLEVKDSLTAVKGTINEIVSDNITNSGNITTNTLVSTNITNSDTITTKNLEVTGQAHFFELIIDKIKAAGGAAIFTPADGFDVDIVEQVTDGYKLYWKCQDGDGNQRDNMWKVNDQALCRSFNQAKVGTSHNVSNKYYWSLVTEVSDSSNPVLKDDEYYNYIVISTSVYDGTVNPEKGDSISMLGYRGTDDEARQSAIYISAYASLDSGLKAPLLAQYRGINDFNLGNHRKSYFDANGSKFVGNFEVSNGQDIETYIINKIGSVSSGAPYIGEDGYWYFYDSTTKSYVCSNILAGGEKGDNAEFYKIESLYEYALLSYEKSDNEYKNYLYIRAQYIIYKQSGNQKTQIEATDNGYHVEYNYGSGWSKATIENNICSINNTLLYDNVSNKDYVSIRLVYGSNVLEQSSIPITYKASAMLVIDQNQNKITSRVSDCETNINTANTNIESVTNRVSTVEQTASGLTTNVQSITTEINTVNGNIKTLQKDISSIDQKADSITSTVTATKNEILGDNILRGQNGMGWSGYVNCNDMGIFTLSSEYTQTPPIWDNYGNALFSFEMYNKDVEISIYQFQQAYSTSNTYNIDCDFIQSITPCTIFDASENTYTQKQIDSTFIENYEFKVTKDIPNTYKIGDHLAVTITNTGDGSTEVHNHIYGTIKEIDENLTWLTLNVSIVLKPAKLLCTVNTSNCDTLEEISNSSQNNIFHYSKLLNRYWIRFVEDSTIYKTFILRFRAVNVQNNQYPQMGMCMLEENVTRPHKYSQQSQITQSMIKQTAEEIKMSVNATYVKIGNGNITLNGDTQVNGSLTINDENTGFVLKGDNGVTEIMPKSIGDYTTFKKKTTITDNANYKDTIYGNESFDELYTDYRTTIYRDLGTYTKGSYININNLSVTLLTQYYSTSYTPNELVFNVMEDGVTKWTKVWTNTGKVSNVIDYSVTSDSKIRVSVEIYKRVYSSTSTTKAAIGREDIIPINDPINYTLSWTNTLPTNNAYMLIGYDGLGVNFGSNKTVFIGDKGMMISYGNEELFITQDGIAKLNKRNVKVVNSTSSSTPIYYTVENPIDTVLSIGYTNYITLPSSPYNGQEVKIYDKSEYTYLSSNGKYVVGATVKGSGSIYNKQELQGTVPRVFTYLSDRWYEEYTG